MEEDTEGLADLRDCLMTPEVALTTVDLLYNRIGKINSPLSFMVIITAILYSLF